MLISPEGHKITCALRFGFKASNNKAEYEALLVGLRLAKEMKAGYLQIFSDSQLVVKQVTEEYQARGERMVAYLKSAQVLLKSFDKYNVIQVPRADNTYVDALARLASTKEADLHGLIPVEHLAQPSITEDDISRQETNKLANSELATNKLMTDNLKLPAEADMKLADSEQTPDNLELPDETNLMLAPCEQAHHEEVNLTQPSP